MTVNRKYLYNPAAHFYAHRRGSYTISVFNGQDIILREGANYLSDEDLKIPEIQKLIDLQCLIRADAIPKGQDNKQKRTTKKKAPPPSIPLNSKANELATELSNGTK